MKRWVYLPNGQQAWVDDGAAENSGPHTSDPGGVGGLEFGNPAGSKGNPNAGGLKDYGAHLEAARLLWSDADNRNQITASTASPVTINRDAEMAARNKQTAMLDAFKVRAAGGGPSVADALAVEGRDATLRAQMGVPRTGGGLGLRAAIGGGATAYSQGALGTAAMKSAEQQDAWKTLGQAAFGVRGADITGATEQAKLSQQLSTANAELAQRAALANQGADLNRLANRAAAARAYGGVVGANRAARTSTFGQNLEEDRNKMAADQQHQDASNRKVGSFINTVGTLFAVASDERAKKQVEPAATSLRELLETASAHEYSYKDPAAPGAAPGRHIGPMAQDLEQTKLGKSMVHEGPDKTKMVDGGRAGLTALAAASFLHKRINKLEDAYRHAFGGSGE